MSKEIQQILRTLDGLQDSAKAVLATVVDVRGSGYRLPGARMLIVDDGRTFGTVSGGCLESDVLERARKVIATGRPETVLYDTSENDGSVFSLNMGCRGLIRVLLESVGRDSEIVRHLRDVRYSRQRQAAATVVDGERTGERIFSGAAEAGQASEALGKFLESGKDYEVRKVETEGGGVEMAFESLEPPLRLLIFGAGADAVPLADAADALGWVTEVYDHRPAYLTSERFPNATLMPRERDSIAAKIKTDDRTAAVVMTHNYQIDSAILPAILASECFYVGALGPRRRTQEMLGELAGEGFKIDEAQLGKLRAPVGLDIGGDSPESIALSIAAEIQSVFRSRAGGPLRERKGSIYARD